MNELKKTIEIYLCRVAKVFDSYLIMQISRIETDSS